MRHIAPSATYASSVVEQGYAWTHCQLGCTSKEAHLLEVVEVLHAGGLAQVDAMSNVLAQHEGADQVISVTSLPCMNTPWEVKS